MKKAVRFLIGITGFLLAGSVVCASDFPQPYKENVTYYMDEETGLVRIEYHDRTEEIQAEPQFEESEDTPTVFIPVAAQESSFRTLNEVISQFPATRNQNPYGTCWAFSSVALAEFDMIVNHNASSSIDYSELGLAYYSYWTAEDKLGNFNGDYRYVPGNSDKGVANSGNQSLAISTLAAWKGLVSESVLPYSDMNKVLSSGLDSSFATMNKDVVLTDGYAIDIKNNPDAVKAAVKKYGAVSINYHSSDYYYQNVNGFTTYYCPEDYAINHAVTIVGWDDSFGINNFAGYVPPTSGAWLIRNSWTTSTGMSKYSYFWMSYADKSIEEYAYVMNFEPGSTYDNNYQHDGASSECYFNAESAANVFVAKNPDGYTSELLSAVMIKNAYANTAETYKIRIYTGLKDSADPTSGTLHKRATTSVTLKNNGIFTVELEEPVPLKPGESFSVVVSAVDKEAAFTFETTDDVEYYDENGILCPWYSTTAHADDGESHFYSGGRWYDVSVYSKNGTINAPGVGNARIKALTKNTTAKTYTISYDLNGGTNHNGNPRRYCTDLGKITLKKPTKAGYYFQGWYKDSSFKNKVTSLSGDLGKNLKLYAKWRKMEYSVKLGYTETIYTGRALSPSVTVKDEYGATLKKGTDYTVAISNNKNVGVGKVVVTFKGLPYKLSKTLRFKIYPKAPTSCKATLTGYDDVKITWSKSSQADGYKVYYRKSTASKFSLYKSTTSTSVTKKDLADGVKYIFKVVPYFTTSDGTKYESTKYAACSAYTLKQISKPTLSVSGTKVKVSWKNIEGETGYQISRSATKGKTSIISTYKTADGKSQLFGAPIGKAYYYKVRAYKVVNDKNIYGPWSPEVKYTRNLAAPETVKAVLYGYDDVKVTWSKVSEADGYTVYYKKVGDSSYKTKGNTTSLSSKIADLADGTAYYVKVVPYSKNDGKIVRSSNYEVAQVTTLKKIATPKAVESDGKIKVSWTNIAGESGYQISQSTTKSGTKIVATYKTTSGKSKVISAAAEKLYYYKVRAYKIVGDTKVYGPWSESVSAKVAKAGSITLTASAAGGTTCTLTAKTYPTDAKVTWSTSDSSVATVSGGKVTAISPGTATITAKITYNGKTYSATKDVTVNENITYGDWSWWSSTPVYASSTLEVQMTPLYRYYCFYCPVCGGREPFSGNSDCYQYTLTGGDWQEIWSPIPYSQCGGTQWPAASSKMYTYSLGDGLLWNFGTPNLWHTAVGTTDPGSGAVVIQQGYRSRSVTTSYLIGEVK